MAQFYLFYNILKLYFLFALSHLFSHYFPFSPLKNSCICKGSTPSLVCKHRRKIKIIIIH